MRNSAASQSLAVTASRLAAMAKLGCAVHPGGGRGADREAAICQAVVELLNEGSYESVTMDAVAARAKASKATIYRRWSNKDDLVIDALRRAVQFGDEVLPDTGNLRDDLVARIGRPANDPALLAVVTAAMKALFYATSTDPVRAEAIRATLRETELAALQTLLHRAHQSGELQNPVDAGLIWEVAQAQFCSRSSVESGVVDAQYVRHLVDDLLMPVILHAGTKALISARSD